MTQPNHLREGRKARYIKNKKQYINCINIFIIICPAQIELAVTFLLIIHSPAATGVNIVKIIIVNSLTINFIFNFTNKYINIDITNAVVIAFPVFILENILFPKKFSNEPLFIAVVNK